MYRCKDVLAAQGNNRVSWKRSRNVLFVDGKSQGLSAKKEQKRKGNGPE
jgi:hypothetical protein